MAIITIMSGSYCHADDIIKGVAQRLGSSRISEILPEEVAKRFETSAESVQSFLDGTPPDFNKLSKKQIRLLGFIETTLAELILADNVIVDGRVGFMIPGNIPHALKVCIIANHDFRIEQAAKIDNVSGDAAASRLLEYDTYLSKWSGHFTQHAAYDEHQFDVIIPMHNTTIDKAIEIICNQAESEAVQTTERSRKIAADFLLGAKVKLALTSAGYDVNVFAESGRVNIEINEQSLWMSKLENKLRSMASEIPGVTEVTTRMGPKSAPPSLNPWDNVDAPPKILLVDDEKEFVHTLSERLKTRNLESAIAYDGEQALDMVRNDVPDVIILDLLMPGIDGIETLRRLKEMNPDIQVIILTGHGSDRERETAEELGAFAYLHKPVNINDLARKMKEAYAVKRRGH
ncbi:MAG: response regulator [Candidatus Zixiibacteriota bacterium]